MLIVFGATVFDTITTPTRTVREMLGGSCTYAAIAASNFTDTGLISVVGSDFPVRYRRVLSSFVDLSGLTVLEGKTFRYAAKYDATMSARETLSTELNVAQKYSPTVPEGYRGSRFVYLANNNPSQNMSVLEEFGSTKLSMCDTINFWIQRDRHAVIRMVKATDAVVINDEEARLLTKEENLVRCAKKMSGWGAEIVTIKKGEHGALTFYDDVVFPTPGYPLDRVVDPTGAGDCFAGGMMGYLASVNSTRKSHIRRAIAYGNVMGSFAVEGYGTAAIQKIQKSEIARRLRTYEKMIRV